LYSEKLNMELVHEWRFDTSSLPFLALRAEYTLFDLSDATELILLELMA